MKEITGTTWSNKFSSIMGNTSVTKSGNIVKINFYGSIGSTPIAGNGEVIGTLPSEIRPGRTNLLSMICVYNGVVGSYGAYVNTSGQIVTSAGSNDITSSITIDGVYMI